MSRTNYKTNQKKLIVDFLKDKQDKHITIKDLEKYLNNNGKKVGLTTIYRCLENLLKEGVVNKYKLDNVSGACFQYVAKKCNHPHFVCDSCLEVFHMELFDILEFENKISAKYGFLIDPYKTMYYGKCNKCK